MIKVNKNTIEVGTREWQPTYTNDLAFNCLALLSEGKNGKYNMASHGQTSFYQLTNEIIEILGINDKIKVIRVDSTKFSIKEKATRPLVAIMQNNRLQKEALDFQRNWQISLKEYLNQDYFKKLL